MKILSVIPLSKGIFKESLTYFTAGNATPGMIITVPFRHKNIEALVVKTDNLASSKGMIKASAFSLRKVEKINGAAALNENFLKAADKLKDYAASGSSAVLATVLPKIFLENYGKLEHSVSAAPASKSNLRQEKLALQNSVNERMSFYKTFIRESFAKKKSVFIAAPTIHDIEFFRQNLSKGIESYVFAFHNDLPKKKFISSYNSLQKEKHPVLVIGTPPYLYLLNQKFEAVVLENEGSPAYKTFSRPFLDMRTWAEILAAQYNIRIIFADTLLRMETLWRLYHKEISEVMPVSYRLSNRVRKEVIDAKPKELPEGKKNPPFAALSKELKGKIGESLEENKKTFLFVHRKGLASITVCNDCQTPLLCEDCGKPLVLYEKEGKRFFLCHHCRRKKDALTACGACKSWNLKALGIGTDLVAEEIRKNFPKAQMLILDSDKVKTPKQAAKIMKDFYSAKAAILVGTEMALHHFTEKIDNVAVVSFDSLFAIPDFKMNERIMRLLLGLERYAGANLLIQTRNAQEQVLKEFMSGNIHEFARSEIKSREEFSYPPFFTPIKIIYRGPQENMAKAEAYLENLFKEYNPSTFRAFVPKVKNLHVLNMVIKIKRDSWSLPEITQDGALDPKLLAKLRALPPALTVQIDPEDLL
jgi:primosomal protein N' (replication factor Y)